MGEDQGEVRAGAVDDAPQPRDPAQLRADIEDTRQDLGDTVAALAEKTDVKARAREKVDGVRATVTDKAAQVKQSVSGGSGGATQGPSDGGGAGAALEQVRAKAEANPVATAALAAFAGGVVFGRLSKRG